MKDKELKLFQSAVIKAVDEKDAETLIIKGKASVYRTPEGFLQIDRDQELMNLDFMDLDSYKKNPIVVVAHQWDRPIGKVTSIENKDGALEVTAEIHKLSGEENIFEAVQKGILKSFSISVVPHEFLYRDTHDGDILEIARSTLVEVSLMPVQSNQDALFDVISSKGVGSAMSISKKMLARQNEMTCDELTGSCAFKAELKEKSPTPEKEPKMDVIKKEADAAAEAKRLADEKTATEEKAKKEADDAAAAEAKRLADEKIAADAKTAKDQPAFDEAALVAAITKADAEKERLLTERAEATKQKEAEEKTQAEDAAKARITNAFDYIKERQEAIIAIPDADFDTEEVEKFYELVSDAAEAIETKVAGIIAAQAKPAE